MAGLGPAAGSGGEARPAVLHRPPCGEQWSPSHCSMAQLSGGGLSAAPSTAAAAASGHVALVALCALASQPRHHSLRALPPSPPLVPPAQPAAPGSVGFGLVSWLVSAASAAASASANAATVSGVPPARPPHRQPASGMGSVSGRSGRAWTPLRVECRGVALRGAHSLQPGCNVLCPPVAPCRYLGAVKCMRAVPYPAIQTMYCAMRPG